MTDTTRQLECSAERTLYVAFELSAKTWRLALTTDRGERPRHYVVDSGDLVAVQERLGRARTQWGLAAATTVVSCYEAGRDGFWLHRCLIAQGLRNVIVDATSIERDRRAKAVKTDRVDAERLLELLVQIRGIGVNGASRLVVEFFAWRAFRNGREVGALAGLTPTPYQSGASARDQGISKAGVARVRTMAVELAWGWLRFQPQSALAQWYALRFGHGSTRHRRIGIVALARKLLIALWRYLDAGVVPDGAIVTPAV